MDKVDVKCPFCEQITLVKNMSLAVTGVSGNLKALVAGAECSAYATGVCLIVWWSHHQ